MKKNGSGQKGFTLVEMVTVVVIVGIIIGLFYSTFVLNWQAINRYITRADLWQDMNTIVDQMVVAGQNSQATVVTTVPGVSQTVSFTDMQNSNSTYTMNSAGQFFIDSDGPGPNLPQQVSQNVNFPVSIFTLADPRTLTVTLSLIQQLFDGNQNVATTVQIYRRN